LEQARRSTLADHVHRNARLGLRVLITEAWYKRSAAFRSAVFEPSSNVSNTGCRSAADAGDRDGEVAREATWARTR
jgi:hypothetical protein